ncbi:hypothetical protein os1_23980 [Comamonadaceae bacterium OS-1]|nr:hypothetical protein os1_23980 [Comamonadaceae bacterium OS-1]
MTPLDILLKEYETLRTEVLERIKIAFSHLGYFGAVMAFAFPASEGFFSKHPGTALVLASLGAVLLLWISVLNWSWVGRIASHLQELELKINAQAGAQDLLTWEHIASRITTGPHWFPKRYVPKKYLP